MHARPRTDLSRVPVPAEFQPGWDKRTRPDRGGMHARKEGVTSIFSASLGCGRALRLVKPLPPSLPSRRCRCWAHFVVSLKITLVFTIADAPSGDAQSTSSCGGGRQAGTF